MLVVLEPPIRHENISQCFLIKTNLQGITVEKAKQLKEFMKIMGLRNWLHWAAWFVKSFIMLSIPGIVITMFLKVKMHKNIFKTKSKKKRTFFQLTVSMVSWCRRINLQQFFGSIFLRKHLYSNGHMLLFYDCGILQSCRYGSYCHIFKLAYQLLSVPIFIGD